MPNGWHIWDDWNKKISPEWFLPKCSSLPDRSRNAYTLKHWSLSSHTGDKIECDFRSICTFEISIIVTDLRSVSPDTCSDETSYKRCVEEQTKDIYHEVIDKKKSW